MDLDKLDKEAGQEHPFGEHEEEAIASLIIDHPEFFVSLAKFIKYQLFNRVEVQFVVASIMDYYKKHSLFPTRGMLLDGIKRKLTVDSPSYEDIIKIAQRQSDPREIPELKERLMEWARSKAYGLLYDPDVIQRYKDGDYEYVEEIFNQARNIQDVGTGTLWFFDEVESLFTINSQDHFTTGFKQLDHYLNDGGPCRKESFIYMAPTGVGKCHTLESKIIEERLSRIFEIELENGKICKLAGFREVQTTRGKVKVCDLASGDDITEIPNCEDVGDLQL